jgi:salicylate hydroxylase
VRVGIVGGGIGGFSAALSLARSGHDITVFERAALLSEVGAGVQISPNAWRVLNWLGLGDEFAGIAVLPTSVVLRRWEDDAVIRATDLDAEITATWGLPLASAARTDLIEMLGAAVSAASNIVVHYGRRVTSVEPFDGESTITFADGTVSTFDVVVGADGIHSVVRPCVGSTDKARFSGSVAYRALVPRDLVEDLPVETTNRVGPDCHVVSYFIGRGRSHLNLVCISPEDTWTTESWTEPGTLDDLRARFEGWSPQLQSILDRVREPVFRWALYDREPIEQWGVGTTTLLGDACHPMLPFMAQGSCQAIEDAAVLGRCLEEADTGSAAASLRRYEAARQARTAQIQTASFRNRDLFHMPDGPMQRERDEFLASGIGGLSMLDWVYSYDPVTAELPHRP